jgi:hypothetical protein
VSFVNEHVSDAGGGFRETVSNISDDLNSARTPLLIPVPNSRAEVCRGAWTRITLGHQKKTDARHFQPILPASPSSLTPACPPQVGDMRDAWMPSPSCRDLRQYEFLGRLMAAAIQCDENIVVGRSGGRCHHPAAPRSCSH